MLEALPRNLENHVQIKRSQLGRKTVGHTVKKIFALFPAAKPTGLVEGGKRVLCSFSLQMMEVRNLLLKMSQFPQIVSQNPPECLQKILQNTQK